jgi:hypothetical protein
VRREHQRRGILAIPRRVVVDDEDAPAALALVAGARDGVPQ